MPRKPAVKIDADELERLAAIGATVKEVAALFGLAQSSLSERITREPLKSAWERGHARASMSVRRRLFEQMDAGQPAILIWLSKQLCDMREPPRESHVDADIRSSTQITYIAEWGRTPAELADRAQAVIEGYADEE